MGSATEGKMEQQRILGCGGENKKDQDGYRKSAKRKGKLMHRELLGKQRSGARKKRRG